MTGRWLRIGALTIGVASLLMLSGGVAKADIYEYNDGGPFLTQAACQQAMPPNDPPAIYSFGCAIYSSSPYPPYHGGYGWYWTAKIDVT
jgi:hypothetical protein